MPSKEIKSSTQSSASAVEAELLPALVATIHGLHTAGELTDGRIISLKCPCGRVILPPILIQSHIRDRQRGLLKAKVERHLRDSHGLSKYNVGRVLKDSFDAT